MNDRCSKWENSKCLTTASQRWSWGADLLIFSISKSKSNFCTLNMMCFFMNLPHLAQSFWFLTLSFFIFYFTILYWFCHTSTCIHHGCTCVPHPELPSHLPPHTITLWRTVWRFLKKMDTFFLKIILLIYFWLHMLFLDETGGGYSLLWCMSFSFQWLLFMWSTGCRW